MAEQSIHEMNVGNQLALDALKRIGSSITGGIRQLNQPPTTVVPNTYSLRPPTTQSAVLPRGQGSALAQQPGITKADVAITPNLPPATQQPVRTELPGGITREDSSTGLRTFTQGTPGQDGYARMVVTPAQQGLRTAGTVQTPGGMTFSGTAADAQKFMEPVGRVDYNSPQYQDFVAYNRSKAAAPPTSAAQPFSLVAAPRPAFGGTGGWKTDIAKYQADTQAYNAAIGEQGALNREIIKGNQLQMATPETASQIGLRNAQATEASARVGLLSAQTKQADEQKKWISTYEEIPQIDEYGNTTKIRKPILVNSTTKEVIRPGDQQNNPLAQNSAANRAAFAATYVNTPERRAAWEALTPEQQDALVAQEQLGKPKK